MEETTRFIDEKEVSRITGRALSTLRNDRHHGRGIPYFKLGKSIRYSFQGVLQFMEDRKIQTDPV